MNAALQMVTERTDTARYSRSSNAPRTAPWEIDHDVLRDREFDFNHKFLPDGLTMVGELAFLTEAERRSLGHVQGRTYAFFLGLVERFICAKILDQSPEHRPPDRVAIEEPVAFDDEEIKYQELFRRVAAFIASGMPGGYATVANPNKIARMVLSKSNWAVLALTCHIELFVQSHYEHSLDEDASLSPLFKDIFRVHWRAKCQEAILDEFAWRRVDARLTPDERDAAVDDLIELVAAVDGIMRGQAAVDAAYFLRLCDRNFTDDAQRAIRDLFFKAYRWQYIVSGMQHRHFRRLLSEFTTPAQRQRIQRALAIITN